MMNFVILNGEITTPKPSRISHPPRPVSEGSGGRDSVLSSTTGAAGGMYGFDSEMVMEGREESGVAAGGLQVFAAPSLLSIRKLRSAPHRCIHLCDVALQPRGLFVDAHSDQGAVSEL